MDPRVLCVMVVLIVSNIPEVCSKKCKTCIAKLLSNQEEMLASIKFTIEKGGCPDAFTSEHTTLAQILYLFKEYKHQKSNPSYFKICQKCAVQVLEQCPEINPHVWYEGLKGMFFPSAEDFIKANGCGPNYLKKGKKPNRGKGGRSKYFGLLFGNDLIPPKRRRRANQAKCDDSDDRCCKTTCTAVLCPANVTCVTPKEPCYALQLPILSNNNKVEIRRQFYGRFHCCQKGTFDVGGINHKCSAIPTLRLCLMTTVPLINGRHFVIPPDTITAYALDDFSYCACKST